MSFKKAATPILVIAIWATGLYAVDLVVNQSPGARHSVSTDSSNSRSVAPRPSSAASVPEHVEQALVERTIKRESSDKANQAASNVADNSTGYSEVISIGVAELVEDEGRKSDDDTVPLLVIGQPMLVDQPASESLPQDFISLGDPIDLDELLQGRSNSDQELLSYGQKLDIDEPQAHTKISDTPKIERGAVLPPP